MLTLGPEPQWKAESGTQGKEASRGRYRRDPATAPAGERIPEWLRWNRASYSRTSWSPGTALSTTRSTALVLRSRSSYSWNHYDYGVW